jgi:hypothetical protein
MDGCLRSNVAKLYIAMANISWDLPINATSVMSVGPRLTDCIAQLYEWWQLDLCISKLVNRQPCDKHIGLVISGPDS